MNKYIDVFCKQNPNFSLLCKNPDCKKEHIFKTKDVLKNKEYSFKCNSCGKTTKYNTLKFAEDIISRFKKLGITVQ